MQFWMDQTGKLLASDLKGSLIDCPQCPCDVNVVVAPTPCCAGGLVYTEVYMYVAYLLTGVSDYTGCLPVFCSSGGPSLLELFDAGVLGGDFHFGYIADPQSVDPMGRSPTATGFVYDALQVLKVDDCFQWRFSGLCQPYTDPSGMFPTLVGAPFYNLRTQYTLDGGSTWSNGPNFGTQTLVGSKFLCDIVTGCGIFSNIGYLVSLDPIVNITAPDATVVNLELTFSITLTFGGVPTLYTANLKYSAGLSNTPFTTASNCYTWIGFFTDCNNNCVPIMVEYTAPGWAIASYVEGMGLTPLIIYTGADYPTSDIFSGWPDICNDHGVATPWSLT